MRLLCGKRRPAGVWLILGLLACAGFAFFGWQYTQAVRQTRLNRNLLAAISSQQVADVQTLLRAGADPNARVLPNTPPPPPWQVLAATLRHLWRHQRPEPRPVYSTALLASIGADMVYGPNGEEPVEKPNVEIIQSLLDAGANPNTVGPFPGDSSLGQNAPLVWAVQQNKPQIVRLLLDKHANIRAQDVSGNSCLFLAVALNHPNAQAIAALLLAHGVNVNAHNSLGETPLITAVGSEVNPALIKLLLDHGADVSARDPDGETALFKFILNNHQSDDSGVPQVTKMLLDAGADVNDDDKFGNSVLRMSVGTKVFPLLLSRGAKIFTLKDPQGAGLLIWACSVFDRGTEDYSLIEKVFGLGVRINVADTDGTTALVATAGRDVYEANSNVSPQNSDYMGAPVQPKLIGYLLKRGASVDAKDKQGRTALMVASEASDPQADLVLLAHGASVNARDRYGRTALDRARTNRFDANSPFDSPALGHQFGRRLSK